MLLSLLLNILLPSLFLLFSCDIVLLSLADQFGIVNFKQIFAGNELAVSKGQAELELGIRLLRPLVFFFCILP